MKIQDRYPINKLFTSQGVLLLLLLFVALYLALLFPWMNRWGLSTVEVNMPLPGDDAVDGVVATSTRGVLINAPAQEVWKWVVQLGQDRAGFYSHDWLENLTFADIHNSSELHPEWQNRQMGDKVLGAGGVVYGDRSFWRIPFYEEGKAMVLWGSIVVLPIDSQTSQLIARTFSPPASPLVKIISAFTYDWIHFVMERGMLLGIKARAEGTLGEGLFLKIISDLGWILASLGIAYLFFQQKKGWWGLLPCGYALAILLLTHDIWAALAGFLWWGMIASGFLLWGRRWWKGLFISTLSVILIFVVSNQPHMVFGMIFLIGSLTVWFFKGRIPTRTLVTNQTPERIR